MNPQKRVLIQEIFLIALGICGRFLRWETIPFSPLTNIIGVFLIVLAFVLHGYSQKNLKQAHNRSNEIKNIVTSGIYSKVRHPIYLSLIIMEIGITFTFGIMWMFLLVILFTYLHILTSIEEEKLLVKKFNKEYINYMNNVPWRILPKIF
ncbi:protein-S-isoprenylcysteine O-methyltransferase Ste14 [Halanaerobium saccharolyticum]|uniref:Protein-S-isoprenylcysteine O-methyltransferase Ste14 n=1 Tax=Halanaerobium saccharolyticum TaxID=43595 RepID=A0A4V3G4I3_9FIRM|nr:isoprenylcysteine carboxylmethyltransferase family protein [Halanaerobium saccharolyticum]RAK10236.1 protein-S-isoprenylcysteine O-methyltransferase Ste14 [Halanaerobium saccharolyticum]TDW00448.1 protein-S-isoprenylcysteine O-methyltransferase Ste14 [Halanaerobium saccharolyticum]TDX52033.1 protein-S-isoprenylcysteine O-methyltransferase Ste14 [Halanaerobium saccharolyticum]